MSKKITLKKALALFGGTDIEILRGYNYRSGFFNKDGQLYYFSTWDMRGGDMNNLLIRTAAHRKDWTGGSNTYPMKRFLEERSLKIEIPFARCDFNRN
jgi:hypothetical protein